MLCGPVALADPGDCVNLVIMITDCFFPKNPWTVHPQKPFPFDGPHSRAGCDYAIDLLNKQETGTGLLALDV